MNKELENNEWKAFAPQLAIKQKLNPFVTPTDYFVELKEHTKSAIFLSELDKTEHTFGFQVSSDYFKHLAEQVNTTICLDENIGSEKAFTVPENYFSTMQNAIMLKTNAQEKPLPAKGIKLWNSNFLKYAAAACFLAISSVGIYRYNQHNDNASLTTLSNQVTNDQFLYDIDESTIIQHINAEKPLKTKNVSAADADMENYLINHYTVNELTQDL